MKKLSKLISITIIIIMLLVLIINFLSIEVKAAQYKEPESKTTKLSNYPGYTELINNLKEQHPTWTFTIFFTGLDWNQVLKNETTEEHARNLVPATRTGEWLCAYCEANKKTYDEGRWKGASETAVAYYMDPRNFLYEDYIFQFEELGYNEDLHTINGVNTILANCQYLQGNKIEYMTTEGKKATINKSYAQVLMEAGKKYNISPYHLASRIVQEQGTTGTEMVFGNYNSTYRGYYNFFNIGATGDDIMANGLQYAKNKGWTTPEKAIYGGAEFLAKEYIKYGQSTLYLQKFDVVDDYETELYYHQYMQNVSAAKTEGETVKSTYQKMGFVNSSNEVPFNFLIPVYENMPKEKCRYPGSKTIVTQNVEIINSTVTVRQEPKSTAKSLGNLNVGTKILRIEIGASSEGGNRWDKVVLANGTKGYITSNYLKQVDDITNCNEKAIANTDVNLRNGPGTTDTTIITTLTEGQAVTVIEKGKYNGLNGYDWNRVKLSDGTQGYLANKYLNTVTDGSDTSGNELVKVVCEYGLKIRESPGINSKCLTIVEKGTILTRTQKAASTKDGYTWDKVVTGSGIIGYAARAGGNEQNIEPVSPSNPTTSKDFKIVNTNFVCIPNTTVEKVKATYSGAVIKKGDTEIKTGNVGTGYKVTIDEKEYVIVVKGDVDGDARITAADYVRIKNHIMGKKILESTEKQSADVDSDGKTTAADYVRVKNYIMGKGKIEI